jgi:hypothetical protein
MDRGAPTGIQNTEAGSGQLTSRWLVSIRQGYTRRYYPDWREDSKAFGATSRSRRSFAPKGKLTAAR